MCGSGRAMERPATDLVISPSHPIRHCTSLQRPAPVRAWSSSHLGAGYGAGIIETASMAYHAGAGSALTSSTSVGFTAPENTSSGASSATVNSGSGTARNACQALPSSFPGRVRLSAACSSRLSSTVPGS